MEAIGIVASLIGISELGVKISKSLVQLGTTIIKAQQQINALARELTSISAAFGLLADVLKSSNDVFKPEAIRTTESILDDCNITYDEINSHVTAIEDRSIGARERLTWPFRKAKIKELQKRLESAKASLSLMVNILNLGTGIAWLKYAVGDILVAMKQNEPPDDAIKKQFEKSTDAVIKVQMAFDEAGESEKAANEDITRIYESLEIPSAQEKWALTKLGSRQQRLVKDIPAFKELTLVPVRSGSEEQQAAAQDLERQSTILQRRNQIKQRAPYIVQDLLLCWTYLRNEQVPEVQGKRPRSPNVPISGKVQHTDPGSDEIPARSSSYNDSTRESPASPPSELSPRTEGLEPEITSPRRSNNNKSKRAHPDLLDSSVQDAVLSLEERKRIVRYWDVNINYSLAATNDKDSDTLFFSLASLIWKVPIYFPKYAIRDGLITIGLIKERVEYLKGFPLGKEVQLSCKGYRHLSDDNTAKSYGIKHHSKIEGILVTAPSSTPNSTFSDPPPIQRSMCEAPVTYPGHARQTEFLPPRNQKSSRKARSEETSYASLKDTNSKDYDSADDSDTNLRRNRSTKPHGPCAIDASDEHYGRRPLWKAEANAKIPMLYSKSDWDRALSFKDHVQIENAFGSSFVDTEATFWHGIESWVSQSWRRSRPGYWECDFSQSLGDRFEKVKVYFESGRPRTIFNDTRDGGDRVIFYLGSEVDTMIEVPIRNASYWYAAPPETFPEIRKGLSFAFPHGKPEMYDASPGMFVIILACYALCISLLPHNQRKREWLKRIRNGQYRISNTPFKGGWKAGMSDKTKIQRRGGTFKLSIAPCKREIDWLEPKKFDDYFSWLTSAMLSVR